MSGIDLPASRASISSRTRRVEGGQGVGERAQVERALGVVVRLSQREGAAARVRAGFLVAGDHPLEGFLGRLLKQGEIFFADGVHGGCSCCRC